MSVSVPGNAVPDRPSQAAVDVALAALPIVLFAAVSAVMRPSWSMGGLALVAAFLCGKTLAAAWGTATKLPPDREPLFVAGVLLAHALCKLPFVDLVPRWDAGQYTLFLFQAMDGYNGTVGSFLARFRLADHPTLAMGLYWAIGQFCATFDYWIVNAQNLLLSLFAIGCFAWLVRGLFPASGARERLPLVAAFAFQPLFFATGLGPNVDLGVCSFLTFALAAFVHGRPGLLAMAGLYLCFSKETGFLLYGGLVAAAGISHRLRRQPVTPNERRLAALVCAPLALYLIFQLVAPSSSWAARAMTWKSDGFLTFGYQTKTFFTVLAEGLLLNFLWIPTLACTAAGIRRAWGKHREPRSAFMPIAAVLFAGFLAVNCLYINFLNPRYLVALVPLALVLFADAVRSLLAVAWQRSAVLAVFALLSFGQVWRTIDPVSRLVFGTMDTGAGSLLAIDPGGQSMVDAQAYNAQFAGIARIYGQVNARIFRDGRRPVVLVGLNHAYAYYYNCCWVDAATLRYTYHADRGFMPQLMAVEKLTPENAPPQAVYLAAPWLDDTARSLERLRQAYRVEKSFEVESSGYRVTVYELSRR